MLHRLVNFVGAVTRNVFSALFRTLITLLVFLVAATMTMHYLGLPVPSPLDLLHSVEGVSKLAKILG